MMWQLNTAIETKNSLIEKMKIAVEQSNQETHKCELQKSSLMEELKNAKNKITDCENDIIQMQNTINDLERLLETETKKNNELTKVNTKITPELMNSKTEITKVFK